MEIKIQAIVAGQLVNAANRYEERKNNKKENLR